MINNCINWDKSSWLSSNEYFDELTNFLIRNVKIETDSRILDIGCGRGHLLINLTKKMLFKNMLVGVEPVNHNFNENKKIKIIQSDLNCFLDNNHEKYNFIILKQVLHLIPQFDRNKLYRSIDSILEKSGKLVIIQMNKNHNFPCFPTMKKKLDNSLLYQEKIINELTTNFPIIKKKIFKFKVYILKTDYISMIKSKFISVLSSLNDKQIEDGCLYLDKNYDKNISFEDRLSIFFLR